MVCYETMNPTEYILPDGEIFVVRLGGDRPGWWSWARINEGGVAGLAWKLNVEPVQGSQQK